jgi:serine/threonine protein kinase
MSPTPADDGLPGFDPTESFPSPRTAMPPLPPAPRPAPDSGNALPPATYLGEFELLGVVGEGGFGIVYRAWDHSLKRQVAIKEYMPASLAARGAGMQVSVRSERHAEPFFAGLQSFVKEAQMLAQFDHPALVKVYRFWEANGSAYMVMPFYEGKTLRDELRQRKEPPDEATLIGWIGPVADALAVIHAEHWYHRDIAPDNVLLLAGSGRPLLLDFGAARRVIGDMTQALTVILKPGYAPVEQYAEIPGMKQGPWTDVYALAGVAYYALRGRTPPPSVGRLVTDSYEPLSGGILAARYSERFLAAIDHALVVRPEGRTRSVAELKAEIGLAPPPSVAEAGEYAVGRVSREEADINLLDGPDLLLPAGPGASGAPGATGVAAPPDLTLPGDGPGLALARTVQAPAMAERTAYVPPPAAERTRYEPSRLSPPAAPPPAPAAPAPAAAPRQTAAAAGGNGRWIGIALAVVVVAGAGGFFALRPRGEPPPTVAAAPVVSPAAATAPAPAPAPAASVAAATAKPLTLDIGAEFDRTVAAQTPGWGLEVKVDHDRLRINKDKLVFSLRSLQEGYVYVFNASTDGQLQQLYPNGQTPAPRVAKGGTLKLPQGRLEFNVDGPAGTSRLLVMVSRWPRDHKAFAPREDGGFISFPTGVDGAVLAASSNEKLPLIAGRAVCPPGPACSDEFGAATTTFEVVP